VDRLREDGSSTLRVPGTAVFLNRGKQTVPLAMASWRKRLFIATPPSPPPMTGGSSCCWLRHESYRGRERMCAGGRGEREADR
jgi:hypothetical protein